jgi:hypothetical protein
LRPAATRFVGARRRLIVVERGASLRVRQQAESETFDEIVTVAQMYDESSDDFSERVVRRVGTAAHSGPFGDVLLYASRVCEHATLSARRLMALAIAGHAEMTCSPAELVVVASAEASLAERECLLELADDLIFAAPGASLPVRLRFIAAGVQAAPLQVSEAVANARRVRTSSQRRRSKVLEPGASVGDQSFDGLTCEQ